MNKRLAVSVLCGGQSTEHEVSLMSARNVVAALDSDKYEISVIYISKEGQWYRLRHLDLTDLDPDQWNKNQLDNENFEALSLCPGQLGRPWCSAQNPAVRYEVDCLIPMLHGTLGEDGTIQGLFEVLGVPYVGSGVLSSSLCMTKNVAKELMRSHGIPVVDWLLLSRYHAHSQSYDYAKISAQLGSDTLFVKPNSLGSSVGIRKVRNSEELAAALEYAWRFDDAILIERAIVGRELECAVLGNHQASASCLGEIIPTEDFYSYTAKYIDPDGAILKSPAEVPANIEQQIQQLAVQAFQCLHCSGMARVDFFLTDRDEIYINEVNTIPGFTNISMYPRLWQHAGVSYPALLDQLIQLAMDRRQAQQSLVRMYSP